MTGSIRATCTPRLFSSAICTASFTVSRRTPAPCGADGAGCAAAIVGTQRTIKRIVRIVTMYTRRFPMTPMDAAEVIERFRRSGALLEGHFRLTSGLHSSGYLQCALVLQHPREAAALGAALGERARNLGAQAVLSPALGGIVIGQEVGRAGR